MKLLAFFLTAMCATAALADTPPALQDIPLKDIDGKATSLKAYAGKAVLLVNVASKCGNTPQYKGLEELFQKYKEKGLVVLGLPCNDFGAQEPGSNAEIKDFCSTKYKVSFPMMDKIHVKGPEQHPLYKALTGEKGPFPGDVKWNFGKFLVGKDGKAVQRFEPKIQPDSKEIVDAVEKALK